MSRETQKKSATAAFTQAIITGTRILGGADVPAYTLQFLDNTSKHKSGDFEMMAMPYVEIGRSSRCHIRFGEDSPMVSNKHAAIERQNNDYIIKQLSTTNPTLVNGRPVKNHWYLSNGDIIQFAMEGPRLRFNISAGGTGKMNFTQKAQLVAAQAIRPYKTALMSMAGALLALCLVGGGILWHQSNKIDEQHETITSLEDKIQLNDSIYKAGVAKRDKEIADNKAAIERINRNPKDVKPISPDYKPPIPEPKPKPSPAPTPTPTPTPTPKDTTKGKGGNPSPPPQPEKEGKINIDELKKQVYFVSAEEIYLENNGNQKTMPGAWTGTGFMLADGRFVTARHVIQYWRYHFKPQTFVDMNCIENSGGIVRIKFKAVSSDGSEISFTYDNKNKNGFSLDESQDTKDEVDGCNIKKGGMNPTDWVVINSSAYQVKAKGSSTLTLNSNLSQNLPTGVDVHILGFSYGKQAQGPKIDPLYSKSTVAQNGLTNGVINVTDRNFGPGNSGGPVFAYDKDKKVYSVVGIVSAGIGSEIGIIIPISRIR